MPWLLQTCQVLPLVGVWVKAADVTVHRVTFETRGSTNGEDALTFALDTWARALRLVIKKTRHIGDVTQA